ncbi:700_t:CDS:1 [Dentiscutata heterogama]|uniref:700_t:CDS:1 n=1 Tax=Dentiscutata heterogama TaxID=1316150 RepID=A0ACA9MTD0_9GLOM|nr:700_t:CDS:1 [Dentiscutata heterogama]
MLKLILRHICYERYPRYPYIIYNAHIKLRPAVSGVMNIAFSPQRQVSHDTKRGLPNELKDNKKIEPNEPQLLKSIQELAQLLNSRGIDLSTGKMPSMIQLSRIAYDEEVTTKFKNVSSQFYEAGIEFNFDTAQKFLNLANSQQEAIDN